MTDVIETRGDYRVTLEPDHDTESPREGFDVGLIASAHTSYRLGDYGDPFVGEVVDAMRAHPLSIVARWLRVFHGATVVLPLGLYDHGGISIYVGTGGGWDSSTIGLTFDTPATRETTGVPLERVEAGLRADVAHYDSYLTGDVWRVTVERRVIWRQVDGDETRETWEDVESVGGFIGSDGAREEALELLDAHAGERVEA